MKRKIFVVKQNYNKDCGAACLVSLVKYYGGNVSLEKVILDTNTNKLGTNAYNLIEASKKYGLDGQGYSYDIKTIKEEEINLPAIFQIQQNDFYHFVVVYSFTKNNVILMDPAKGKTKVKTDEFLKTATGVVLEFFPINKIIFYKKNNQIKSLINKLLKKERKAITIIGVISFCLVILTIISNYYFKIAVESFTFGKVYLNKLITLFMIISILKVSFNNVRLYYTNFLNKTVDAYLLKDFLNHVIKLPSKIMQTRTVGEITSRINDLGNFKTLFSEIFISLTLDFLLVLILVPILIYINKYLFFITLLVFVLYLIIGLVFKNKLYNKILNNITINDKFFSSFIEKITMIESIKNLNKENESIKYLEKQAGKALNDTFLLTKFNNFQVNLKNIINEMGLFVINSIGLLLVYRSTITILDLITFNSLVIFFLDPIKNIVDSIPNYIYIKASIEKLNEFMNIELPTESEEKIDFNNYKITIKDASFGYNNLFNVFNNVNLIINQSEHVLLKGQSGSGKSTLCNILAKNNELTKGNIFIGDINIKDVNAKSVKENVLYVSQKENLYTDSLKNNIKYFRNIKENDFHRITKMCAVDKIIENRPLRYNTLINVDTNNFSGGEIQRIVLARSLLNDFKILILDEALSEVDSKTEEYILKELKTFYKDKTIIYVSHKNLENHFDRTIYV